MDISDIRDEIKTILESVTGVENISLTIGIVHKYFRWSNNWDDFIDLFKNSSNKINGCMFTRISTPERRLTIPSSNLRVPIWKIIFIMGLNDADETELDFQDLIEGICTAFRTKHNLNNDCDTIEPEFGPMAGLYGIQVDIAELRVFGGILCHYAELRLCTQFRENRRS